ncbi:hypothetical protein HAX54_007832 [Datura stramonium]|uniref:Uncharacterized protein n=1 Tax=Datura stramonium TaxID=4076 RepID=A0ABS8RUZ9_DATST|nr:hypothetical protein [Datura stramonium]
MEVVNKISQSPTKVLWGDRVEEAEDLDVVDEVININSNESKDQSVEGQINGNSDQPTGETESAEMECNLESINSTEGKQNILEKGHQVQNEDMQPKPPDLMQKENDVNIIVHQKETDVKPSSILSLNFSCAGRRILNFDKIRTPSQYQDISKEGTRLKGNICVNKQAVKYWKDSNVWYWLRSPYWNSGNIGQCLNIHIYVKKDQFLHISEGLCSRKLLQDIPKYR